MLNWKRRPIDFYYVEKEVDNEKYLGYICGFIASDGCLCKDNQSIRIEIQEEDKCTLQWIFNTVVHNPKILKPFQRTDKPNTKPMVRISIVLPKLYQYCLDMGITPNKSLTLDVKLDDKSDEFKWYFLRGVIDGDGSVHVGKKLNDSTIRICSASTKFINNLKLIFGGTISNCSSCKILQFKGRQAKELCSALPKEEYNIERKTHGINEILKLDFIHFRRSSKLVGTIWGTYDKPKDLTQVWEGTDKSINFNTFKYRVLMKGMSIEDALSKPVRVYKGQCG